MANFHMVTPHRLAELGQHAKKHLRRSSATYYYDERGMPHFTGDELDLQLRYVGEYLHALEDSFSHQASPVARDFKQTYTMPWGHGLHGHETDWTWDRTGIAMDMAKETFRVLKELCLDAEVGGKGQCGQPLDWN